MHFDERLIGKSLSVKKQHGPPQCIWCWPGFTSNDLESNDKIVTTLLVFMLCNISRVRSPEIGCSKRTD